MSQPSQLAQWPSSAAAAPAVGEIYDEYAPFVWRNLRRLGVPADQVEDAVQDVFLVVHRRLSEFQGRSSLRTWIFGILMRVASRYRENLKHQEQRYMPATEHLLETLGPTHDGSPFDHVAEQQAAELVTWILGEIDEDKRTILVMVELEHLPVVEAARVLEINVNTAYTRLRLARRALETKLESALGEQGAAP